MMLSREERELILNGYKTPRNTQMHVEVEALCKHADSADKVIAGLVDALEVAHDDFIQLPSGADLDADPNNASPEDGAAHNAGLAVKRIQAALDAAGSIGKEKP